MKALLLSEYKKLDVVDMQRPQPGDDDLLIRVKACGIRGSDVHGYDGSAGRRLPPRLGQSVRSPGSHLSFYARFLPHGSICRVCDRSRANCVFATRGHDVRAAGAH
jgi:Zn-dependent alcohol dehydrogenase